jgi:hypothetical protein
VRQAERRLAGAVHGPRAPRLSITCWTFGNGITEPGTIIVGSALFHFSACVDWMIVRFIGKCLGVHRDGRCFRVALRASIDKALKMLCTPQEPPVAGVATKN